MKRIRWLLAAGFAAMVLLGGGLPSALAAQGVTTGGVGGQITDLDGQPVVGAQILVINRATGFRSGTTTRADGRYALLGLELGSRYAVEVRRLGFAPTAIENVEVGLAQLARVDVQLQASAVQLGEITVTAMAIGTELSTATRSGVVTTISDSALNRLPSLNRNFTDFVILTPQVSNTIFTGGLSGGGVNNRYNHIQIDGASETDLFGLGSTGQPGGQAEGKSIAIESVKQYQVLLTPFDVRQGNFAGLLVNAVTKSGTNDFHGSVYGFGRNDDLTRSQDYIREYQQQQFGAALGGPIVRDRAHFFINPEWQRQRSPADGLFLGATGLTLSEADANRFRSLLEGYGIPAGDLSPVTNENPLTNIFGRVDVQLPRSHSLVVRHNYGSAERDVFFRGTSGTSPAMQLSNYHYFFQSRKNSTVAQLRSPLRDDAFNELIMGYNTIRDRRTPNVAAPDIMVTNVPGATLIGGGERFSHANELDQDIFEITNNFTYTTGTHTITAGAAANFYKVRNLFRQSSRGVWRFAGLDAFEAGQANRYIVGVPVGGGDGAVRFGAAVYAAYVQDQWTVSPNLTLSGGLRMDVPSFNDRPPTNPAVQTEFGRNTADIPSGNVQWSPRISFTWDATGDQRNLVRGGVGAFAGHPAYVWLSNSFQNSGVSGVAVLTCAGAAETPVFNAASIANPPSACADGRTAALGGEINLLASDLRFPQTGRISLGYDRALPHGLIGTLEGLYTVGVYSPFYDNIALAGPQGVDHNGRVLYGPQPGQPVRRAQSPNRNQVFEARNNRWDDYSYNLTAMLRRPLSDGWEGTISYTFTRAYDVQSLTSSTAFSQTRFGRVWADTLSKQVATRSTFEQPHRFIASGTYTFPTNTSVSLIYTGSNGTPLTYVTSHDLNGNGLTLDDPIYIPTDATLASEILFAPDGSVTPEQQAQAFNEFIDGEKCLRENRGRLMPRNACRAPWVNLLNTSVRQSFAVVGAQNVSLQLDIFNTLNLLNKRWGLQTSTFPQITLLTYTGLSEPGTLYNTDAARPVYTFTVGQDRFNYDNIQSNYQLQLSLRYDF
ncbi:MAG TPA: carboxypeptidase regulatory-like domain-containing protein [Gemmatimonadaceae bacterium]|nr:carboxypeptidase regulatory-like domain-containing protein [Gemmatimonadaceae bacterium]